jgi:predicted ATPase/DNA-binding winged helix-turn-helix (wHTH) protein
MQLVYGSGECEIDLANRELRVLGSPVRVGARTFGVIEVLAQSAGELVSKDELINRIWPGTAVPENTLHVHAMAVRKALGRYRGLLKTEPGRGYRLLGGWSMRRQEAADPPVGRQQVRTTGESPVTNLPVVVTRLVGRATAIRRVQDLASAYRAVTLTGPGGIGKTSLAIKVARRIVSEFSDGVWLVELASLSDPALAPTAVAQALRLDLRGEDISAQGVARAIGARNLMLLLDNCEHIVGAVAHLAEMLLRSCPRVTIVTTSRELLRIQGETVYRVPPLDVPSDDRMAADQILGHSAPDLFVTRARHFGLDIASNATNLPTIAAICRNLDGIPLAIEFAAARAATVGVERVAAGLRDRFALLTTGRRTALPRHRTLRATLDWSYALLPEPERCLLRRLSVFPAGFTVEAVIGVMHNSGQNNAEIINGIVNLAAKSLVAPEGSVPNGRWRLLESVRAYALQKLSEAGEAAPVMRFHAEHYRALFERAEAEWDSRPIAEMRSEYGREIDHARAAIDWAFSPDGDALLGVALTAAAAPLWMHLSLLQECRALVERAIAALHATTSNDPRSEMKLHAALGATLAWIGGSISESDQAWIKVLHLAESFGDTDHQLRSLWGLWLRKKSRDALPVAHQFLAVSSTPTCQLVGNRMIAVSSHYLGHQTTARHHIERAIAIDTVEDTARRIISFQFDQRLGARAFLARILWMQGFPDRAIQVVKSLIEDTQTAGHAASLCHSLAFAACPIAHWAGDLELARYYTDLLRDTADQHALFLWRAFGKVYQGVMAIRQGDAKTGLPLILNGFDDFGPANTSYRAEFVGYLADALAHVGQASAGLARIQEEIDRCEQHEEFWIIAELLRIKGEFLFRHGTPEAVAEIESCFRRALDWTERQDALSWALRVATSYARLLLSQGRPDDAQRVLAPVYDRLSEGHETADAKSARALLMTLK